MPTKGYRLVVFTLIILTAVMFMLYQHLSSLEVVGVSQQSSVLTKMFYRHFYESNIGRMIVKSRTLSNLHGSNRHRVKVILLYTERFGSRQWYSRQAGNISQTEKCEKTNCFVTYDRLRIVDADAVVFHATDMFDSEYLRMLSRMARPRHQYWVYYSHENPLNSPDVNKLGKLFNWTMTYKSDSDIVIPYGSYKKLNKIPLLKSKVNSSKSDQDLVYSARTRQRKITDKHLLGKSKFIAWITSHCGLLRDQFVMELEKHLPIDVCGRCSPNFRRHMTCNDRHCVKSECMDNITMYKFYLAFENSFCTDYVTEKYWRNAIENNVVPIVLGGANYSNPMLAIPGSYIDASKFKSIKALADYLLYLDKNDHAYSQYFKWMDVFENSGEKDWSCLLCDKLNSDSRERVYTDLSLYWNRNDCGRDQHVRKLLSPGKKSSPTTSSASTHLYVESLCLTSILFLLW